LDLLSDHLAELMEKPSGDRQNQSAYAAFDLTYRRLPPEIKNIIHILSFFHFANFPMAVISHAAKQSFREDPFPFVERNAEFESAIELLEETFIPGGTWSKLTLPNLVGTLQNYSLASFTSVPLTQFLRMHPLMCEWAFDRIPHGRRPVFQEAARRILVCCTDAKHMYPYLPSHIEALTSRPVFGSHLINDRAAFGKILRMAERFQDARNTWLPIYNTLREEHGADNLHVATAAYELADTYDDDNLKQMEALEREALRIRAASLGPQHLETLKVMSNLSGTLSRQARYEEAVTIQEEVLRGLRSQLPPDHPDIAEAVAWLAYFIAQHNKLEEAEKLQHQLLQDQTARLGATHLDTLEIARDLAHTYFLQGRYSEAEVLNVKVFEGRKAQLGETHLDTLHAMQSLAMAYARNNRHSDAAALQVKVLDDRKAQLGAAHLDTITAMSDLASTYKNQGKYPDAELLFTQVIERQKVQLGETHVKTLGSMLNLAKVYFEEGRHSDAESLQVKVIQGYKEKLSATHSTMLVAMGDLALSYYNQSRHSEAETLQVEALDTRVRLGDDNSSEFATCTHNLAYTYYSMGRLTEARVLANKAERIRRTMYGIEHPIYKPTAHLLKLLDETETS
jgi:tetratricopeptide (TPR) repeat protein